jgi:hypothetical protein
MKCLDRKRLVFSFFLNKDSQIKILNRLHIKLLARYIKRFDEVIFCIIVDDKDMNDLIEWIENEIIKIYDGNISFKIYENTNYRESYVFNEEIVKKMKDLDGLTFFAHNKGVSYDYITEETLKWVTSLYYFNFEIMLPYDDLNGVCFYGALKNNITIDDYEKNSPIVLPKYNWVYMGTFFWAKYQEVFYLLKKLGREVPIMTSRWFDEMFPGNILEMEWGATYENPKALKILIDGQNIDEFVKVAYGHIDGLYEEYINFHNSMIDDEMFR